MHREASLALAAISTVSSGDFLLRLAACRFCMIWYLLPTPPPPTAISKKGEGTGYNHVAAAFYWFCRSAVPSVGYQISSNSNRVKTVDISVLRIKMHYIWYLDPDPCRFARLHYKIKKNVNNSFVKHWKKNSKQNVQKKWHVKKSFELKQWVLSVTTGSFRLLL